MPKDKNSNVEAAILEALGDGSIRAKNVALERRIIACCFQRKAELEVICSNIQPEYFSDPRLKTFYEYTSKTFFAGKIPDVDVCLSQASRSQEFDIDPEDYATALRESLDGGSECELEAVCHELRNLYTVRRLLGFAKRISASIDDGTPSVELIGQAEESLKRITVDVITDNTLLDLDQVIASSPIGINEFLDPPRNGIATPWSTVNDYTGGWKPGQMVTFGARPGAGKSAALTQALYAAAAIGHLVVLFSLEMNAFDIWTRIFCDQVGVKSSDIMHRQLSGSERERIQDFIKNAAPRNFLISDRGGKTPLSMRSELARIQAKHGKIAMVGVDYIQLMTNPGKKNRVEEVGSISTFLKRTSMDFDTRVLVAAQLNRLMDNRPGDDRPKLSDLKESGSIEQDSDLVILLHRPSLSRKPKDGIVVPDEFIIAKQRRGRVGSIPMDYQGEYYRFVERKV